MFTQLVTLPLAPFRGAVWVADQLVETAEREYYDPAPVKAALVRLERDLVDGRITDEEFDRREDELLDRLDELEQYQRRLDAGR
nr:gas vesicle protein GvpG [Streptomyces bauhiniae]